MINLTPEERRKFSEWLRQEAASAEGLARQTKSLSMPAQVTDAIARRYANEALAYTVVAKILDSTESMEIG